MTAMVGSRPMMTRLPLVLPVIAALLSLPAADGLAQGTANGQFGISPARRDVAARPPVRLAPARVTNTTSAAFDVTVFSVFLRQQPEGNFTFSERKTDLNAANNIVTPAVRSFRLEPGAARTVGLTWNTLPSRARAAYMGVVFQGIPIIHGKKNVNVTNRLLSVNFLRLPGRYTSRGRFDGMRVIQAPAARVLRFLPAVRNTGNIVAAPTNARLVIETRSGRHLYTERWTGDVVLPGVTRIFTIDDKAKVFPAGDYTAVAIMDFGRSRHQTIHTNFHLTGPNTLPSPEIAVANFHGDGTIGKPAHLAASVRSTGTAPASVRVGLALYHIVGGPGDTRPVATARVVYANLRPGARRDLEQKIGMVAAGHYRAVLSYRDPNGTARSLAAEFDAVTQRSSWDRFKRWISDHAVLLVGLLALLLLLAIVAWFLRRQRRLERELAERRAAGAETTDVTSPQPPAAAIVAPAPAAPAEPVPARVQAPGAISINTATAEELQQLPGVGPRAAARIIEHREEYGAFGSLEDLGRVEGFDAERLAGLADRARFS